VGRGVALVAAVLAFASSSSASAPRVPIADERAAVASTLAGGGDAVFCGGPAGYAALTFDDGPSANTEALVRILREKEARATWFDLGENIAQHPDLVELQRTVGYVGNHTWTHPHLSTLSDDDIRAQLVNTQAALDGLLHEDVRGFFRPPFGNYDARVLAIARELGLVTVMWSSEGRDWEGLDAAGVESAVMEHTPTGSIVLLHDNALYPVTVAALPQIIDDLRARGFTLVTVPELLALDPPTPERWHAPLSNGCWPRTSPP
jgi:peptidoglycan/xylan/chitin deacetylase (PgdA/CDA1 family)